MAEYLRYFPDNNKYPEAYLSIQELAAMGKILAPGFLGLLLKEARDFLTTEPGDHLLERQMYVPDWLNYWQDKLYLMSCRRTNPAVRLVPCDKILSLNDLKQKFTELRKRRELTGIWNMATGEGGPAHREVWTKSLKRIPHVAVLFEPRIYFDQHPNRREPCFPEAMRASLAVYFGLIASETPIRPDDFPEEEWYTRVFAQSGANINFTTAGFPHWEEQLARNPPELQYLALIENEKERHTSQSTRKLAPDYEPVVIPTMEMITEK